jgi:hypothetical protein
MQPTQAAYSGRVPDFDHRVSLHFVGPARTSTARRIEITPWLHTVRKPALGCSALYGAHFPRPEVGHIFNEP